MRGVIQLTHNWRVLSRGFRGIAGLVREVKWRLNNEVEECSKEGGY